jgi:hypothetical protein
MPFTKGSPKLLGSGRRRGTPNRLTAQVKDMVREALHREGVVDYLRQQARENPVAFMALVGRLIPHELKASIENNLPRLEVHDYSRRDAHGNPLVLPQPWVEADTIPVAALPARSGPERREVRL